MIASIRIGRGYPAAAATGAVEQPQRQHGEADVDDPDPDRDQDRAGAGFGHPRLYSDFAGTMPDTPWTAAKVGAKFALRPGETGPRGSQAGSGLEGGADELLSAKATREAGNERHHRSRFRSGVRTAA